MRILSKKAYLVLLLGDISILYLSVWVTLTLRHLAIPEVESAVVHLTSFSFLFIAWFVVYFMAGLYGRYTVLFRRQLPNIIFAAQAINVGIAALFFFLIPFFEITPKTILFIYLFVSTLLLYFWRVHVYPHVLVRREIGAVLVGTGKELTELAEEVNRDPLYPLEFRAIVHPELSSGDRTERTIHDLIERRNVSAIVADMGNRSLDALLRFIYDITFIERSAEFIDVRRLYQEIFQKIPLTLIDDRWLLRYVALSDHFVYAVLKRIVDIALAFVLGVLSLFVYPFIMLAMYLEDGRPFFVRQERIGQGGRPIIITKFRSMTGSDTGQAVLASEFTVTKVGAFLRRTRFDELPQLWAVLTGSLSFVGPRPELPALVTAYRKNIPHYNLRHLVKPGLSGWAQIMHDGHPHHGVDADATSEKLAYDLHYVKERGLWLDISIMALTLKTLLTKRGS